MEPKKKPSRLIFLVALILIGCAPPTPSYPVEVTRLVERTVIVTQLVTIPPPATLTPQIVVVTATPVPTPVFSTWTVDQVAAAIEAAGLELVNPTELTKKDYGIAPMTAKRGLRFGVPSLCSNCGGRIFEFDNQTNLDILRTYYDSLGVSSAAFFSWVFVRDNILIQINGDMDETKAREYESVLANLKQ